MVPMLPSIMWPDTNMASVASHIAIPAVRCVCNPAKCPYISARPIT